MFSIRLLDKTLSDLYKITNINILKVMLICVHTIIKKNNHWYAIIYTDFHFKLNVDEQQPISFRLFGVNRAARCLCSPANTTHANVQTHQTTPARCYCLHNTQSMPISRNDPLHNESQMEHLRKNRGMTTHFGRKMMTVVSPAGAQMGGLSSSSPLFFRHWALLLPYKYSVSLSDDVLLCYGKLLEECCRGCEDKERLEM